jgi:hypothetical protein
MNCGGKGEHTFNTTFTFITQKPEGQGMPCPYRIGRDEMVCFWYGGEFLLPVLAALLPESGCCCRVVAKTKALLPGDCQKWGIVAGKLPKGVFYCRVGDGF